MPSRIERRIGLVNVATGMAANGWIAATDGPVPSNKKWNVNAILQSTDGAATRNAALALAGGLPTHGIMGLPVGPTVPVNGPLAVSPAGTYMAFPTSNTRVDLYARLGPTGLVFVDSINLTGGTGWEALAFSPDERWLAMSNAGFANVFVVGVSSVGFGALTNSAATGGALAAPGSYLGWSPTGAYLAAVNGGVAATKVQVAAISAGVFGAWVNAPNVVATDAIVGSGPVWAPDESVVATLLGRNATSVTLYGWKWVAGAFSGAAQTTSAAPITSASTTCQGSLEWSPYTAQLMVAGTSMTGIAGAPVPPFTVTWTGAAWGTVSNFSAGGVSGWSGNMKVAAVAWLGPLQLVGIGVTSGTIAEANAWVVSATGAPIARVSTVIPSVVWGSTFGTNQMQVINGQVWRLNAAGTGVIIETFLAPSVILFPIIGILANTRQQISGLTLEAGDRLLVGTPAATDKFAAYLSAIEIG